jgi:hypothetical protein
MDALLLFRRVTVLGMGCLLILAKTRGQPADSVHSISVSTQLPPAVWSPALGKLLLHPERTPQWGAHSLETLDFSDMVLTSLCLYEI